MPAAQEHLMAHKYMLCIWESRTFFCMLNNGDIGMGWDIKKE